ncbi:MAG TPA: GNAT family N-acetyltransferase [Pyrinomonadaceae bacterium]|nr:GNAT family N-acetyltransferase [Pyrinomonadaceae bacterium]
MDLKEVRLESERLVLRWFREDDFDAYAAIAADEEVMKFIGGTQTRFEAWRAMASHIGHWYFRGYGVFAVEEKTSGEMIGRIGFMNPPGWPGFEIGWTLARASWGKGYATEGARRAMQYAFTEMNRDHLFSCIAPENINSARVAERLGETVEGETELLGKRVLLYGINHEQWLRLQQT